jgi:hypothetical protein
VRAPAPGWPVLVLPWVQQQQQQLFVRWQRQDELGPLTEDALVALQQQQEPCRKLAGRASCTGLS